MTTLPSQTKMYQLNEKEWKVFELKYAGKRYEDIGNEVGMPVRTLKEWFRKGGTHDELYSTYVAEQNDMRREEARRIIRQNINKAASVLADSLVSRDEKIKLKASIELLNRELGQPRQEIDLGRTTEELDLLREIIADGKSKQPVQDRRETDNSKS